jgi:DNA-binding CsgD family transcriptional regulator/tetratricopeptide (TPR) repeat protein
MDGVDRPGRGWWAEGMAGLGAFVGREIELSRLAGALGGDARMVLVVGDAGVGKTRFAGEVMARAAAAGMVMVRGECLPLAEKLPLLPVAEALGELSRLDDGELLEAALAMAPLYVPAEVARLLPRLAPGGMDTGERGERWRRERLFSAMAELLGAVARRSPVGLVVEDVHWADSATLDCLTYLSRTGGGGAVTVVATCRGDEASLDRHVAQWLAHMRGGDAVVEIRLVPLSRGETAEQITGLVDGPVPSRFADDLYARAEGNPFFTEQLVAAAQAGPSEGGLRTPSGLPERLAELLVARAARCGGDGRTVLAALAVAGRPLTEELLTGVTALEAAVVRAGLRELAAARLLADGGSEASYRPRHALLAEAVAAALLPGERVVLHERTARALEAEGDAALAAEVAGHWAAVGCRSEELRARVLAARAAEGVFSYAEAALHWERAIELCQAVPDAAGTAGADMPWLYLPAIDALEISGAGEHAGVLAEEAYRRFADHPDPAVAAVVHLRAAVFRGIEAPAAGLPLIREALRLFAQAPPSADHAEAWIRYADMFVLHAEGRREPARAALNRALELAEAAGATALIPRILAWLTVDPFFRGQTRDGFALLDRGRALAEAAADGQAVLRLAVTESDALLEMGKSQAAAEVGLRGLQAARQAGRQASPDAIVLAFNAAAAMLALGRTAEAAALIDPLTAGPPGRDRHGVDVLRVEIDMLRGDLEAAAQRQQQMSAFISHIGNIDHVREVRQRAAELALWSGRPGEALQEVGQALAPFTAADLTILSGWLLALGMRACADLAEQARARRDDYAIRDALTAAGDLGAWVKQMKGAPFTDHPFVATVPARRATWDAERTRLAGASDPAAWRAAAKTWEDLGCPHRAGYAWWRHAEAQLTAGQPAAAAAASLRAAAAASVGHAPLLAQVRRLAERARIPLDAPTAAGTPAPYGLTGRELAVLRLVAAGRSNAQIGAELFISPRTAGVHVTNILRKLGVTNRVQAAALAERAGLLDIPQP